MAKLIGYRHCSFTDRTSNKSVSGYLCYFVTQIESGSGAGYSFDIVKGASASCFVKDEDFNSLHLVAGKEYTYSFTRMGKIDFSSIKPV